MPRIETVEEFEREVDRAATEVLSALRLFHTVDEINRYAAKKSDVLNGLNRDPEVWVTAIQSMQAGLFNTLYRIFDDAPDAHSFKHLQEAAVRHMGFFSRECLEVRKRAHWTGGFGWLPKYLDEAWYPAQDDIRALMRHVRPYKDVFIAKYEPIRSRVIAHSLETTPSGIEALYAETNTKEVRNMVATLFGVTQNLQQLVSNGRPFGDKRLRYRNRRRAIRSETRALLDKIAVKAPRD